MPETQAEPTFDSRKPENAPNAGCLAKSRAAQTGLSLEDPWVHRSARMHCRTCMYCVPKRAAIPGVLPVLGRCRRHAPTMSGFPVVFLELDFCGDHKLDEASLGEGVIVKMPMP